MNRRQLALIFASMAAVTLIISGSLTVMGYWPVLPFAGAELMALGAGLWVSASEGTRMEIVTVSGDRVAVDKGRRHLTRVWEAQRAWARILLLSPAVAWYPSRLVIRSHGQEVQLGSFLSEQERRALAQDLGRAIAPVYR
jgi:uncharacterized membrane protein